MKNHFFNTFRFFVVVIAALLAVNIEYFVQVIDRSFVKLERRSVNFDENITVSFHNFSDQNIWVFTSGCSLPGGGYLPKLEIEKKSDDRWVHAGAPVCIEIATPHLVLAPEEVRKVTFPVTTGFDEKREEGLYRYKFDIRSNGDSESEVSKVPTHQLVSEAVRINH